jgi:hypothetical protein
VKRIAPTFTNLGMHYVYDGVQCVLVQVEVNVRGLLAVHARRLIKSKRGQANLSRGTVRMSLASPDDQERAREAQRVKEEMAELLRENQSLRRTLTRHNIAEPKQS